MEVVGEERTPDLLKPQPQTVPSPPPTSPTTSTPTPDETAYIAGAMGAISVLAAVLSARLIVLVSVVGAIALAWKILAGDPSLNSLIVLAIVGLGIVPTCVALSLRGR